MSQGERQADIENTFQVPGYARVDAFAAYHWKISPSRLSTEINIDNLLEKDYFFTTEPGERRRAAISITVIGSLRGFLRPIACGSLLRSSEQLATEGFGALDPFTISALEEVEIYHLHLFHKGSG